MKIELYINRQLADIGDPSKFSVYLKRQFYNPTELNTKDAQASYSITLPATNVNNSIFAHANVEEVKDKFNTLYDAELIVNGIRIFEGKFKLSELDSFSYKGNLGIPKPETTKDIFGDKNMNELGNWILELQKDKEGKVIETTFDMISRINNEPNPDCIFPFALYGLMPRNTDATPLHEMKGILPEFADAYEKKYKYILDDSVRFGLEDIPPSVNCLAMLRKIFDEQGYKLTGSAFSDRNLQNLYVSYSNPNDYMQGWNWGDLAKMKVSASWKTIDDNNLFERQIAKNTNEHDDYDTCFNINLFNCNNLKVKEIKDSGINIIYDEYEDDYPDININKYKRKSLHLTIPQSGYYKVKFKCNILELEEELYKEDKHEDTVVNLLFAGTYQKDHLHNDFSRSRYELQVMRDFGERDFKNVNLVGIYKKPQFNHQTGANDLSQAPKFYPFPSGPMVIDPSVNMNFVNGFRWGAHHDSYEYNLLEKDKIASKKREYKMLGVEPNYMFIKNGYSWDKSFEQKVKIFSAYNSLVDQEGKPPLDNYYKFGVEDIRPFEEEKEEEEEDTEIEEGTGESEATPELRAETSEDQPITLHTVQKRLGFFMDQDKNPNYVNRLKNSDLSGDGYVESIIWLERGERLAVCLAGDMGDRVVDRFWLVGDKKVYDAYLAIFKEVDFTLEVEPYRTDIEWNTFDNEGNIRTDSTMKWNEGIYDGYIDKGFPRGYIDLKDFLPSNVKADAWIEQFCKAFNLSLINVGNSHFELNHNQSNISSDTARVIDIDTRTHILHRINQTMALPSEYRLGFTVRDDEEGYVRAKQEAEAQRAGQVLEITDKKADPLVFETGDGVIRTRSIEDTVVEQRSNFSYCWYMQLYTLEKPEIASEYLESHIKPFINTIPIISKHEVWEQEGAKDYKEMLSKLYFDSPQRFWYKKGTHSLPLGMQRKQALQSQEDKTGLEIEGKEVQVALVGKNYQTDKGLELTYESTPHSISQNYFFVPEAGLAYTEIECHLSPEEYNRLNVSLVRFNGSLYHAVSVDGYDPSGNKPAKLKLIPKLKRI